MSDQSSDTNGREMDAYSAFSSDSSEQEIGLSADPLGLDHTNVILVEFEILLSKLTHNNNKNIN